MDWNADQVAQLRALWAEGHSTTQISRQMGTSKNAVVGKAHRLGLPARPSPIRPAGSGARPAASRGRSSSRATLPPLPVVARPAPVVAAPPVPVAAHPLMRGGRVGCRWPIGEPRKPGFRYCDAADVVQGRPYCAEHCARAYTVALRPGEALAPRGWVQ